MDNGWFNTQEQLPGLYGNYLIIIKYQGALSRDYDYEVAFYDDSDTWYGNSDSYSNEEVLAWRDLPTLPSFLSKEN